MGKEKMGRRREEKRRGRRGRKEGRRKGKETGGRKGKVKGDCLQFLGGIIGPGSQVDYNCYLLPNGVTEQSKRHSLVSAECCC